MLYPQQNAISLARVASLVGKSLAWNLVKHRPGFWMKFAGIVVALITNSACKNNIRATDGVNSTNKSRDSILIPFKYFPLSEFTSSESPDVKNVYKHILSKWNDSSVQLPKKEIAKLIDPLFDLYQKNQELSGVDKMQLLKYHSYYPISSWENRDGNQFYVIIVSGDDLIQRVLFKKILDRIVAIKLTGGVCAGPILENETVIVPCEAEAVELSSDEQIRIRKYFLASSKSDNSVLYSDSGLIELRITGTNVDTTSKHGVIDADQFFKLHDLQWADDSILYPETNTDQNKQ